MDSIFGIGLPELILILIIAGMVMGPERIVRTARWFGRMTAQLQGISRSFFRQLNSELEAADSTGELKGAVDELAQLRRQMAELRAEFTAATAGMMQETRAAMDETQAALTAAKQEADRSIAPPGMFAPSSPGATTKIPSGPAKTTAYRLPSFAPPAGSGAATNGVSPTALPRRVEIADDPDE
jgi:Sec-independent protein translocase protein TatA